LEIFSICDAATISSGKVNMLGAFDTIYVSDAPTIHRSSAIVVRLRFDRYEKNSYKLSISIQDENGNIKSLFFEDNLSFSHSGNESTSSNFILNVQDLKFEKLGTYYLLLKINDKFINKLPIFVKKQK